MCGPRLLLAPENFGPPRSFSRVLLVMSALLEICAKPFSNYFLNVLGASAALFTVHKLLVRYGTSVRSVDLPAPPPNHRVWRVRHFRSLFKDVVIVSWLPTDAYLQQGGDAVPDDELEDTIVSSRRIITKSPDKDFSWTIPKFVLVTPSVSREWMGLVAVNNPVIERWSRAPLPYFLGGPRTVEDIEDEY